MVFTDQFCNQFDGRENLTFSHMQAECYPLEQIEFHSSKTFITENYTTGFIIINIANYK